MMKEKCFLTVSKKEELNENWEFLSIINIFGTARKIVLNLL